jgi:opacity protein-like surface antigen
MKEIIRIKRRLMFGYLLFFLLTFSNRAASAGEAQNFKPRLNIKLSGGPSYFNIGDVNTYLMTYDTYLSEMTDYRGGEIKTVHHGSDLEAELRWDLNSKFALSAGIGYIYGKNKIIFSFVGPFPFDTRVFPNKQDYVISLEIKNVPLELGIYYTLPFHSRINLFLNGGLGYYFSKVILYKCHYSASYGLLMVYYSKEEKFELNSKSFGFYGGIGLEYNIANNLALVLEVKGRYARANPQGKKISSWFEGPWTIEEGNLYIGERNLLYEGYGEHCPDLIFSKSKPIGDEFQNMREAILDLSGFSLRAGIRIKLF